MVSPSFAVAGAVVKATVGATLFTVTVWVAVAPVSLSLSVALADTFELAGPSGNVHWNEPVVFVFVSEAATLVPFAPQVVVTLVTVSCPGSEIV